MPIIIANKPQLTGIIILFVGVALLAFTFINAFLFLQEPFSIIASGDLARVFGDALAPLIQACIRLMYLGIMGWIGSLLTVRGIPLVIHKHVPIAVPAAATQAKPQPESLKQLKPQLMATPQPQPKPAPAPKPQPAPQAQTYQSTPQPVQKEPQAMFIPPENQREE
ncbi:MAG: hypothetical protein NWE91_01515 [Candidatus Bathyarchaeota archaeon]|nr:hypothetical protein [Candidatus Bathyarchaeota archaeon]